jgi:hypothetical protein
MRPPQLNKYYSKRQDILLKNEIRNRLDYKIGNRELKINYSGRMKIFYAINGEELELRFMRLQSASTDEVGRYMRSACARLQLIQ